MAIDVTDATFQADVIDKSSTVPVVVDLWAPWCGPCRTLGPIIEKVVDATEGKVVLVKVNVDENPQISAAFRVQSIPAVYALRNGQVVDGFVGAVPERDVERFVQTLLPTEAQTTLAALIAAGDEASLRKAIELDPGNEDAVVALATLLVDERQFDEALALLERIPESERTRPIAAAARLGDPQAEERPADEYDAKLAELLPVSRRRRGAPAVRRHPRGDGGRRSAHRRVPQEAQPRAVLTRCRSPVRPASVVVTDVPPYRRHRSGGAESRRNVVGSTLDHDDDVDDPSMSADGRRPSAVPAHRRSSRGSASSGRAVSSAPPGPSSSSPASPGGCCGRRPCRPKPACRWRHRRRGGRPAWSPAARSAVDDDGDRRRPRGRHVVHVTGAVQAPGVYELEPGQRVADAIDAAGGRWPMPTPTPSISPHRSPTVTASPCRPSARRRSFGVGAAQPLRAAYGQRAVEAEPIDINTASAAELETLPGIGPATAAAIVEHRAQHGPYASVDDLEAVRGIGPAKLEAIRDRVTV